MGYLFAISHDITYFTYELGQEIAVDFPDLKCATSGVNNDNALLSARPNINRSVTLPAWLNAAALERNINFSQVLQDALKAQLHLG